MDRELHQEPSPRDVELPGACSGCGGAISARLGPAGARAVCLACHAVTELGLLRNAEGLHLVQVPRASA